VLQVGRVLRSLRLLGVLLVLRSLRLLGRQGLLHKP
jgi:hypothetical protein